MLQQRLQQTIARPVMVSGYGYWSGRDVRVEFRPAEADSGITFVRDDLNSLARVPAKIEYRQEIKRRSNLNCQGVEVGMVEHIMAALAGLRIDNCEVGVDQEEMPGCDGSSLAFVQALDAAGIMKQDAKVQQIVVQQSVRFSTGDSWIEAHLSPLESTLCSSNWTIPMMM